MRLALLAIALPIAAFVLIVLSNTVFRPPPADERLAGAPVT